MAQPYSKLRLDVDGYHTRSVFLIISRPESMTFTLKKQHVKVINDGAIILRNGNPITWLYSEKGKQINGKRTKDKTFKTILSIEV